MDERKKSQASCEESERLGPYLIQAAEMHQYDIKTIYGSHSATGSVAHTSGLLYNQYIW
ncbi:hypothetical protein CYFUS_002670 [Cystobacter fuscus]|uniref:Uncharacterized protein n=1 Tax=Cystobacter fuscus TaxID=43 RepID=A0A250IZV3_9BACT|nr:hypothetical protein [Cystobacter fuscus]ATB37249.1 hypothetical protein CYFUS_002670 [Cystobacter fuscus]